MGLPNEVKEGTKVQSRTERPRAFVERAEYPKGTKTVKRKGLTVQEKAEAPVRHKHRHEVHFIRQHLPLALKNISSIAKYASRESGMAD